MRIFLAAAILAAPMSLAEERRPLTAIEFETITQGATFAHDEGGVPYGAEIYFPNQVVIWKFLDTGECIRGEWYPQGDAICFDYEDEEFPHCWRYYQEGAKLWAESTDGPFIAHLRPPNPDEEISCPGFAA